MKRIMKLSWVLLLMLSVAFVSSCKDDETEPEVIASFTFAVDASDFMKVAFTNESKEFKSLSWDFGDASALSTETNPVHTYSAVGEYTVKLTATSPGGATDVYSVKVTIADPNAELTKLVGETSKTWKLLRQTTTGRFPLEVGPAAHNQIWWAFGNGNELSGRPCMLNDEWTFSRAGLKMDFDAKGDYWAEGGLFTPDNICALTADPMLGPGGEDLSAWGNGSHTFVLTPGSEPTLQVVGLGAYLGLCKVATDSEVKVPQASVTYKVIKLEDATVDTLVVETAYTTGDGQAAYWRFVLVHYDNPADEPQIAGPKPNAQFDFTENGNTISCTNTTTDATSYLWDFGDGATSSAKDPTHTYTSDGIFAIRLTATNANGTSTIAKDFYYTTTALADLTDAMLQGGAWKVRVEDKSIFVGDGLGHSNWWSVPMGFLTGAGVGGDDWSCIVDDEYTFGSGGVYTYATKGSARNDGYFGGSNGCIDDAAIANSGNGAAFGSATHSYTFTPAAGPIGPIIKLINGAGKAAFIGFYKGFNGVADGIAGGENTNSANAPNGGSTTNSYEVTFYSKSATKEYIVISVDYSATHDRSMGWTTILTR